MVESKIELTERLRREGRWAEASAAKDRMVGELRASGIKRGEASRVAWERMAETYPPIMIAPVDDDAIEPVDVVNDVSDAAAFEEALSALPATAPYGQEIDWIRSHSAMARQIRSKSQLLYVTITPKDIVDAPSRAAVFALSHWANNPKEFFKMVLSEQKKITESSAKEREYEEDPSLEEAERLLNQLMGHRLQGSVVSPVE